MLGLLLLSQSSHSIQKEKTKKTKDCYSVFVLRGRPPVHSFVKDSECVKIGSEKLDLKKNSPNFRSGPAAFKKSNQRNRVLSFFLDFGIFSPTLCKPFFSCKCVIVSVIVSTRRNFSLGFSL